MNKTELIEAISKKSPGVTKKAVGEIVDGFISAVGGALKKGDSVTLIGFGTFEVRKRAARTGRNPQTGASIKIAASKVPAFRAGAGLKGIVNGGKK